jgi:hypothetical protein
VGSQQHRPRTLRRPWIRDLGRREWTSITTPRNPQGKVQHRSGDHPTAPPHAAAQIPNRRPGTRCRPRRRVPAPALRPAHQPHPAPNPRRPPRRRRRTTPAPRRSTHTRPRPTRPAVAATRRRRTAAARLAVSRAEIPDSRSRTVGEARVSALRQLILQAPAPVIAAALGVHHTSEMVWLRRLRISPRERAAVPTPAAIASISRNQERRRIVDTNRSTAHAYICRAAGRLCKPRVWQGGYSGY